MNVYLNMYKSKYIYNLYNKYIKIYLYNKNIHIDWK